MSSLKKFYKSIWFFPVVLLILLLVLTALKISGTSVGIYHQALYGDHSKDSNLLFNQPQPIRSDEWLFLTQLTVAQSKAGYPRVNHNLGTGRDVSVVSDVPYKDWSAIFKPQNLVFFVLHLEYAFAFKWWLLLFLLICSCYFFTLRIMPGSNLFSILFSMAIGLSPFVFWWYQTATIMPLVYGFLIMIIGMRILNQEPQWPFGSKPIIFSNLIYTVLLIYLLVSFALVIYPPFQISIAIVTCFFLSGYLLKNMQKRKRLLKEYLLKVLPFFAISIAISIGFLVLFVLTRYQPILSVEGTVYPGHRITSSGHLNPLQIFDSFMLPQLQNSIHGANFFTNQSEASNFILLLPFLILPGIGLVLYEFRTRKHIDWLLTLINLCSVIFLVRVFVPFGDFFYKFMLLNRVPNERLIIGVGFVGVIQSLLVLNKLQKLKLNNRKLLYLTSIYGLLCLGVLLYIGFSTSHSYPLFIKSPIKIIGLAVLFAAIITLWLNYRKYLAVCLLLLFSFVCVIKVHPLYRGLGLMQSNKVLAKIQEISKPTDSWVTLDSIYYENFAALAGRNSISGVQIYPDNNFWRQADNTHGSNIYNRYAHVVFKSNPDFPTPLHLIQGDSFEVAFRCTPFIKNNVEYVLSTSQINTTCTDRIDQVSYPHSTFYFYKIK